MAQFRTTRVVAALCATAALGGCSGSGSGSGDNSGGGPPPSPPPPPPPPNILFILADDFGAEASSLYPSLAGASGQVSTPNLAALAGRGIVFDNVWANPVCSPTRAAIVSGQYGHRTGVTYVGDVLDAPTTTSIFEYVAQASPERYAMAAFGKWHLGPTAQHVRASGVPTFRGFVGGGIADYFDWTYVDLDGNSTRTTAYSTTVLTDFAIDFIAEHRRTSSDPWFVYLAYNAPHGTGASTGFQVPPAGLHSIDVGGLPPGAIEDSVPVYQAMIQALDTEIGRLLAAIGPPGTSERDNTIVIFMGDNGTPAAVKDFTAGVRGFKSTVLEGGIRVPLVISGARTTRRGVRDANLVVATDLYATIAELAGIPVRQIADSFSLVPLLASAQAATGRRFAFTEMCTAQNHYAIRDARYKLSMSAGAAALYDLSLDLRETTNRVDEAELAHVRTWLEAELLALRQAAVSGCLQ